MPTTSPHVVAGVSGDQPSVVLYALHEAARLDTSLRIVHCGETLAGSSVSTEILDRARLVVEGSGLDVAVDYLAEVGDARLCLEAQARTARALVLGADHVAWLQQMLGGEVSGHLALSAACPVVVVPHALPALEPADGVVVTLEVCNEATARASLLVIGRPHGNGHSFALTRPVAMLVLRQARCPVAIVPTDHGSTPVVL
jgi:nucleotide-binding universal stress UspA family protein